VAKLNEEQIMMLPIYLEPDPDAPGNLVVEIDEWPELQEILFLGTSHRGLKVYRARDGRLVYHDGCKRRMAVC
jgi:hypothetical protein